MRKNILLVSFVSAFLLTQTACEDGKEREFGIRIA